MMPSYVCEVHRYDLLINVAQAHEEQNFNYISFCYKSAEPVPNLEAKT